MIDLCFDWQEGLCWSGGGDGNGGEQREVGGGEGGEEGVCGRFGFVFRLFGFMGSGSGHRVLPSREPAGGGGRGRAPRDASLPQASTLNWNGKDLWILATSTKVPII